MTSNHLDQLAEWWETAEQGAHKPGDTIIIDLGDDGYRIDTASTSWVYWGRYGDTRILARAPKPKPAWHDAVAVMAVTPGRPERRVFIRDDEPGWWGDADSSYETDELAHVTPLIEAKVTDEAVARVSDVLRAHYGTHDNDYTATEVITAALGIETA